MHGVKGDGTPTARGTNVLRGKAAPFGMSAHAQAIYEQENPPKKKEGEP